MTEPLVDDRGVDPFVELQALAGAYAERTLQQDAAFLSEQARSRALAIAVLGQFKRGKSSLLNALLKMHILPTGRLPLTGVVTRVLYSPDALSAVVWYHDGRSESIDASRVARYVTENQNPANELGVERVDLYVPADLLKGAILVDTPGIGSAYLHNTQAAHAVVGRIDLALFVTGPEPPITQEELDFLKEISEFAERIIVVISKIDRAAGGEEEIVRFTRRMISQTLPLEVRIFAVDAINPDERLDDMRDTITQILKNEGRAVLQRARERRIERIAEGIRRGLELRRAALLLPEQMRDAARARFAELVVEVQERADDVLHTIDRFPAEEIQAIDDLLASFYDAALADVTAEVAAFAEKSAAQGERALHARFATIEELWSDRVYAQMRAHLDAREGIVTRRTAELAAQFLQAGCQALGLQSAPAQTDIEFGKREAISRMAGPMPTTGLELVAGGLVAALPGRLRAQALRYRFLRMVPELLDRTRGRVRSAALEYLTNWRYVYRAQVLQRLAEARSVVEDAFAHASRASDQDQVRARLSQIEDGARRLQWTLAGIPGGRSQQ